MANPGRPPSHQMHMDFARRYRRPTLRLLSLWAGALFVGALLACGSDPEPPAQSPVPTATPTPAVTRPGPMQQARKFHTAELLQDGRVLVVGGQDRKLMPLASAELYDPETAKWSLTGSMTVPRRDHATALLPDGRVLAMGGLDDDRKVLSSAEIYDPQTGGWSPVANMAVARRGHEALLLADGKVLVFGGRQIAVRLLESDSLQMVETFDPASGEWSNAADMVVGHIGLEAVVLEDGRVLVTGGMTTAGAETSSAIQSDSSGDDAGSTGRSPRTSGPEMYDPVAGKWSQSVFARATMSHTLTLLEDGLAVQVGGFGGIAAAGVPGMEMFDPRSDKWETGPPMTEGRMFHTATLLEDGKLLVIGGTGVEGNLRSAEVFDPAAKAWSPAGRTSVPRSGHTATLLQDGTVLVAGGGSAQAEMFHPANNAWR